MRRFTLAILMLVLSGCMQRAVPVQIVKVVIRFPKGTSIHEVNFAGQSRVLMELQRVTHVQRIETVARAGVLEAYVQIQSTRPIDEIRTALASGILPPEAGSPDFSFVSGPMPMVTPTLKPQINIHIDREKLSAFGIESKDFRAALAGVKSKDNSAELADTVLFTREGQPIRLKDVAILTTTAEPDCIVHQWP